MQNTGIEIFYLYDALQSNSSFDSRYKFTAKELDNETNYTYTSNCSVRRFGARYYDSDLSSWLSVYTERVKANRVWESRSVDPMASARSWVSPYSYCQSSPVGRVSPTGVKQI
jgi:RHS repeat-associated protein